MSGRLKSGPKPSRLAEAQFLLSRGEIAKAKSLLQTIRRNDPDYPRALNALGLIARQNGDGETALRLLGKAVALRPADPELRSNLGNLLARAGRLSEARRELETAVTLAPQIAGLHNNLGQVLQKLEEPEAAANAYARAAGLEPRQALFLANWGSALADLGELEAAEETLRRATRLDPRLAEAWSNLGLLQSRRRAWNEALENLETAARLAPKNPRIWVNLSTVRRAFGRLADARAAAATAIALAPGLPDAHQALAAAGRLEDSAGEIQRLESLLADDRLTDKDRSNCAYALGKLLDDAGHYDRAFAAYAEANRCQRRRFDAAATATAFQSLTDRFGTGFVREHAAAASQSEQPVFVIGMPRSGTTLVEQIIASHPQAAGAGELPLFEQFRLACEKSPPSPERIGAFVLDYLQELQRYGADAQRVVDKRPFNFQNLGLIRAVFPKARIVHCRRDPRDTCLSIFFTNFNDQHAFSTGLDDIAAFYDLYAELMGRWRETFPEALYELSYEDLIAEPEAEIRRLIAHLGLDWDPACLAFDRNLRPVDTPSDWQVRQPIHAGSIGRWRHYERHLAPLLQNLIAIPG